MKKLLMFLIVLAVVAGAIGYFAPKDYHVENTIVINAAPEAIHEYVGDLKKWPEWTPWAEGDPNMVVTYGARTTGVGASQTWVSKDGDGELTFTGSDAQKGIEFDMAFVMDGTRAPSSIDITYTRNGASTEVAWIIDGSWKGVMPPVMDGWMAMLAPMLFGPDFEKGLTKLKLVVENA